MSAVEAADAVDRLFQHAIEHPDDLDEHHLVDFMSEASTLVGHDREQLKPLRRAVRLARKLSGYWSEREGGRLPDWRNGVDEALGVAGWRPQLELVENGLEVAPDPAIFAAMKDRYRAVNFTPWLEGIDYDDWLADR